VFATHLHLLVDLLADVPRLTPYRMEVVEDDTAAAITSSAPSSSSSSSGSGFYHLRPTWRIQPGHCFESLAFTVAAQQGLPQAVLAAAEADYRAIVHDMGGYQALTQVLRRDKQQPQQHHHPGGGSTPSSSSSSNGSSNGSSGNQQREVLSHPVATSSSSSSSSDAAGVNAASEVEAGRRRSRRYRSSSSSMDNSGNGDAAGGAASFHWTLSGNQWLQPHSADRARLLQLLEAAYHFDTSEVSGAAPGRAAAAAAAATELGREQAGAPAAAAADNQEDRSSSTESASRRRRRQSGQPDELSEQAGELSAAAQGGSGSAGVECGIVHELLGTAQPPPAHAGRSAVYALLFDDGWWYVGETQNIATRRGAHRVRRGRKQEVAVWYILVPASKERKLVQGNIITSLQAAGFNLLSSHDAAMAYRK
jgi:hypothetical protein